MSWLSHHHGHHQSVIHCTPAALKLAVALGIIITTVVIPPPRQHWFLGATIFLGGVAFLSRLPLLFLLKRLVLLSPFVLGVALVNAWSPAARVAWTTVAANGALCLLTVVLVSNTTPFSHILAVLKRVRVPGLLITTIALMHRYLFVLADESERMRRARASRTFVARRRFEWRTLATVASQLFIRATERAERIYDAMCARGWQ
jgi:cobalt/nickel transport system permease protein